MSNTEELSYLEVLERIGVLAEGLIGHPDRELADQVTELLDWVDAFHREGLGRLVEMVRAWRGEIFLENASADPVAGPFLAAYGLGEGEVVGEAHAAVDAALDEVRPLIESHGGSIEVDSIAEGVVSVRLQGTCDGCPSSSATLTYGVEAALREHWPHFRRLEVVDPAAQADPAKAGLTCVSVPEPRPAPRPAPRREPEQLLQIRPYKAR